MMIMAFKSLSIWAHTIDKVFYYLMCQSVLTIILCAKIMTKSPILRNGGGGNS